MTAERDSMTLNEIPYPSLGASSLRSSTPRDGRARATPDPEGRGQAEAAPVQRAVSAADP